MGVGAGVYMYIVAVQKFTFAISSPDEFLFFWSLITLFSWLFVSVLAHVNISYRIVPARERCKLPRRWKPVGSTGAGCRSGRVASTLGDRCVTGGRKKCRRTLYSSTNLKLKFSYYKVCDFLFLFSFD